MIYYTDSRGGNPLGNGLSPESAVLDYTKLEHQPGDTLLFKRGSLYRHLYLTSGKENAPITYGAYGEGENPTFACGTDVSDPEEYENQFSVGKRNG